MNNPYLRVVPGFGYGKMDENSVDLEFVTEGLLKLKCMMSMIMILVIYQSYKPLSTIFKKLIPLDIESKDQICECYDNALEYEQILEKHLQIMKDLSSKVTTYKELTDANNKLI